jgi:hypothetical protein
MKVFVINCFDSEGGEYENKAVALTEVLAKKEVKRLKQEDKVEGTTYNKYSIEEYEVIF